MLKKISTVIFLAVALILVRKLYFFPAFHSDTTASSVQLNIYDTAELQELLDKNPALVNTTDDNGNTALCNAALYGKFDAAKLLLEKGADVNARTSHYPPLYWAAWGGDMAMT
jgi:ankyrin repeat protein